MNIKDFNFKDFKKMKNEKSLIRKKVNMEKEKKVLECIENEGLERRLTLGKHYSVEHTYFDKHNNIIGYHILDDLGVLSHYFPYHFVEYLSSSRF